jgi:hypothetical protein
MRARAWRMMPCLSLLMAVPVLASAQAPAPPALPAGRGLALVERWLTGEFDNFQQFYEAKESKAPVPFERVHGAIAPIAVPGIGEHVLLSRQSSLRDVEQIDLVHVYSLVPGPADSDATLRLYEVADPAVLAEAREGWTKPVSVKADQLKLMDGCDLTWRREGEAFAGTMKPGSCRARWPNAPGPVTVVATYRLTADGFAFSEQLTDEAGKVVFGRADGAPLTLMRARLFNCYAAKLKEGTTDKFDGMLNVAMHDQGKWVTFRTEDGKDTKYSFELSQLRYNQKVPVMKLALYEAGKEQAFAYTWAETTSTKIGINLRWMQVGCSIK